MTDSENKESKSKVLGLKGELIQFGKAFRTVDQNPL